MNLSPSVSVVMPVYNAEDYLEESVESILGQSLRDFEFIIIDDGSTDESPKILDQYQELDSRVRVLHEPNSGIAASLNLAIRMAAGKYIARMDADDISLPNRLARQVEFMEGRPEVGVCGTGCRHFGDRRGVATPAADFDKIRCQLLFWPVMVHPTVMMRREVILREGLFYRTDFEEGEDYELWYRFSQCCRMANVPETLVSVRMHGGQKHQRRDEFLDRWANIVRREAIRALGIEPTDEDIRLHQSICRGNYAKSRDCVEKAENWLCRLLEASEKNHVLDPATLAQVVFECWCRVCAFGGGSVFWRLRKFRQSKLYLGRGVLQEQCMSIGASRLMRTLRRCIAECSPWR